MMIPAQPNSFKYIGYKSINKNIIGSNCITSLCRDHEGILWIGTDNDGIYGITTELKQKSIMPHMTAPLRFLPPFSACMKTLNIICGSDPIPTD